MATIKAYTDLSQSKKLAEILPLESADMRFCFSHTLDGRVTGHYPMIGREPSLGTIPCWSLAALLNIIQKTIPYKMEHFGDKEIQLTCVLGDKPWELIISDFNNEVDACVAMIEKLHEHKML